MSKKRQRIHIMASVLVAIVLAVLGPTSYPLASLLAGGRVDAVDEEGGARIRFGLVAGDLSERDLARQIEHLEARGWERSTEVSVDREGTTLVVSLVGAKPDVAERYAQLLTTERRIELALVVERSQTMLHLYHHAEIQCTSDLDIRTGTDDWADPMGGHRSDVYLAAQDLEELRRYVEDCRRRAVHAEPALTAEASYRLAYGEPANDESSWRTYLLRPEPRIDGRFIKYAKQQIDQVNYLPEVRLLFDDEGGEALRRITAEHIGSKLAIVLDDQVLSAPIIMTEIPGSEVSLHMDPATSMDQQLADALELAETLRNGPLPFDLVLERVDIVAGGLHWAILLSRLLVGLLAGGAMMLLLELLGRATGARREPAAPAPAQSTRPLRGIPITRIAVTIFGVAAVLCARETVLPGVSIEVLSYLRGTTDTPESLSILALGLLPLFVSFAVVELMSLVIAPLRRRRLGAPEGKRLLHVLIGTGAMLLSLLLGLALAFGLESVHWNYFAAELVGEPGWGFRLLTSVTVAGSTFLLAALASMIGRHGIGNGYAVLFLVYAVGELWSGGQGDLLASAATPLFDWRPERDHRDFLVAAAAVLGTLWVLRIRTKGPEGSSSLRVPASGILPVALGGWGIVAVDQIAGVLGSTTFADSVDKLEPWVDFWSPTGLSEAIAPASVVVLATVLLSLAFSRGYRPTRSALVRTTSVSVIFTLGLYVLLCVSSLKLSATMPIVTVSLATAAVVDLIREVRARTRRRDWVAVWSLDDVQLADGCVDMLRAHGIESFLRGASLRSLLHVAGGFVPAEIYVLEQHAREARQLVETQIGCSRIPAASLRSAE